MNIRDRKAALTKLAKETSLNKTAQEVLDKVNQSPDSNEDFGHKIFMELLNNIEIEGFEDLD